MPHVSVETLIDAPAQGVFALSQDYAQRLTWDPFLRALATLLLRRDMGKRLAGLKRRAKDIAR